MSLAALVTSAFCALALCASCRTLPRVYGADVALHTEFSGGYRALDHPVFEGHEVLGLEFVTQDPEKGFGYELGGIYGNEEEGDARQTFGEFGEYYLGLRRTWRAEESVRPYVGLGGTWMRVETTLRSPTSNFDEHSAGGYVHGGVLWSLGRYPIDRGTEVVVGFDARGVVGDEVDYAQLAIVIGFGR